MKYPDLNAYLRKKFRKLKTKFLEKVFGRCYIEGHRWKMQHDGWQSNPDFDFNKQPSAANPLTKKMIYYKCKNCPDIKL